MLSIWFSLAFAQPSTLPTDHLDVPESVELRTAAIPWAGGTHHRVEQRAHGLRIDGSPLLIAAAPDGRVVRTHGEPVRDVPSPTPTITADSAAQVAESILARVSAGRLWEPKKELVFVLADGELKLAWAVDVGGISPLRTARFWIDAHTGDLLDGGVTSHQARGNIYPFNPENSEVEVVELPNLESDQALSGAYCAAMSCDAWGQQPCESWSRGAAPDADGDYLPSPDPASMDDPFAEVQTYFHVDRIAAYVDANQGFRLAEPVETVTNFPLNNASYLDLDGDGTPELAFGQDPETGLDYAYDADVIYHEFGHAIIADLAPAIVLMTADEYGTKWVGGAAHEGTADVWAMVMGAGPEVGEYAGPRDLDPDRTCPDDLRGETHLDGIVLGAFAWNLIDDPAVGPDVTADLFYGANPYWGPDLDWPLIGTSILDSAADLLGASVIDQSTHDAIAGHLEDSNILDCGRVIDIGGGETYDIVLNSIGLGSHYDRLPAGTGFSVDVPENATSLRFEILGVDNKKVGWTLYGRSGKHVEHRLEGLFASDDWPVADTYDWEMDGKKKAVIELLIDSDPPLVPGEVQYFALSSRNLGEQTPGQWEFAHITFSATVTAPENVDPDPGEKGEGEERGGCGCSGASHGPVWSWLALLVVAASRRRSLPGS